MANNTISFEGVTINEVYENLTKSGLTKAEAGIIAAGWIYENIGRSKRVFNYREGFPGLEGACNPPAFVRQFQHADWTDGEDVVQAGATVGEEGFNARFHKIEHDLDHLGADLATAFACMAQMRASLRKLLDELRAEINQINTDIYNCCNESRYVVDPGYTRAPYQIETGIYKGTTMFMNKRVSVWETKAGIMMLPAVETMSVDVLTGGRGKNAGAVAKLLETKPEMKTTFPRGFTVKDFNTKFGEETLEDGRKVKEVLNVLPDTFRAANTDELVEEIIEREAANLRSSEGTTSAVTAALGVEAPSNVGGASLDKLGTVPDKARAALIKNGISTLNDLAAADPKRVSEIMKTEGVSVNVGDANAWRANAKTITRLGR